MDIQALVTVAAGSVAVAATATAAVVVVANAQTVREVVEGFAQLRSRSRQASGSRADLAAGKRLLGLHQRDAVVYRNDNVHPLYRGRPVIHPDNRRALVAAAGDDYFAASARGTLEVLPEVRAELDDNLALIGSPTSEGVSRLAFGYEPEVGTSDSLTQHNCPVDFPFRMILNHANVPEGALARRFVEERGAVARRNWRIESDSELFVPELGEDGWLRTDYLLVTRLRNFLTPEGFAQGHSLLSFAGTHGTATRGVELLLREKAALRAIADMTKGKEFASFQALFRVSDIRRDKKAGSKARQIELVRGELIGDEPARWQTASEIVKHSLPRWRLGNS